MARVPRGNLQELAKKLGVAPSTVSRVLNGKAEQYRISIATRDRVLEAAKESGVVVDHIARGLRLKTTETIGLIIPDISNPFFSSLARRVEQMARQRGYSVLLADSQERTDVEAESIHLMLGRRVDGLVIAPVGESSVHFATLLQHGPPVVFVDRVFPDHPASCVMVDNFAGARIAVQHLVEAGHRSIACLQGVPASSVNRERVRGFQKGLLDAGLVPKLLWIAGDSHTIEGGEAAARKVMEQGERPTAVLALGNLIALGAMRAFRELGLQIPRDVSLITFDEQPWAALLNPAVTTVAQPITEIGEQAMSLLFAQLKESATNEPSRVTLPVSLISRDSVGAPPAQ